MAAMAALAERLPQPFGGPEDPKYTMVSWSFWWDRSSLHWLHWDTLALCLYRPAHGNKLPDRQILLESDRLMDFLSSLSFNNIQTNPIS